MLPVLPWDDFTNYQLCYWYALETIRRQRIKHELAVRAGCKCRYLKIEDLRTPTDVWALLAAMGIDLDRTPEAEAALETRVGRAFNLKEKSPPLRHSPAELETQERVVIDRIQLCLPELNVRRMVSTYLAEPVAAEVADVETLGPQVRPRRATPVRISA